MVKGRAIGGPRNGVILEASIYWDGTVRRSEKLLYPGKYVWDGSNWVWEDGIPANQVLYGRSARMFS